MGGSPMFLLMTSIERISSVFSPIPLCISCQMLRLLSRCLRAFR